MTIRTNLPAQRRPLLGRDADLASLRERLAAGARLVTLTGSAGFGSSSLARALGLAEAGDPAARWRGGVVAVDVPASGALVDAVATALGVTLPGAGEGERAAGLGAHLRELGATLLVLDDVERDLHGTRALVPTWLDLAPELTVVAVSREALGLPDEVRHVVGPLPSGGDDPREVGAAEALFTIRAEAVSPGCSAALGFAEAARALVRRLDRNPLAIEVAAARMTVMTPASLLGRLDERLRLLRAAPIGAGRGLWDSLAESWEALTEREQRALMRLAALRAPAPLEALEHVADDGDGDALAVIEALARKSLVATAPSGPYGEPRLALYETVRAFAREQRDRHPGLEREALERMASWFTDFATAREAELRTSRAAEARKALVDAFENLLAVVEATADPTRTARLLVALEAVFRRIGSDARALAYHERLAPHLAGLEPRLRVRVEVVHATHLAALGREADAERAYASAIATARGTGDAALVGYALYRAHVLVHYGPAALAALERRLREATSLLAEHGSTWDRAAADQALGLVLLHLGRGDESREALERAIAQMRRGRLSSLLGPALNNLGHLEGRAGDWEAAAACLREALGAARDDGDKRLECVVRRNLGECALRDGDYPAAHAWLESASAIAADVGVARIQGVAASYRAGMALLAGDTAEAARLGREARAHHARAAWHDPVAEGLADCVLAIAEAAEGGAAEAAGVMARARGVLAGAGDPTLDHVWEIHAAHLDLVAGAATPDEARARADEAARAAVVEAGAAPIVRAHQLELARRLLDATLARRAGAPPALPAPGDAATVFPGRVALEADGRAFTTAGGERVSLGRKASARRVLARLAEARLAEGGRPLDVETLFEVGWPGDRVQEPWRSNRVYVLIAKLRGAGLGEGLAHDGDGYVLAADVDVVPPRE